MIKTGDMPLSVSPSPTFILSNCFLNPHELINTTSYDDWTVFNIDGKNITFDPSLFFEAKPNGMNGCRFTDGAPCLHFNVSKMYNMNVSRVYIEQTLDVSQWNEIVIASIVTTNWYKGYRPFMETECNGQVATQKPSAAKDLEDAQCLPLDVSMCDSLTLRVGAYSKSKQGDADNFEISKIGIVYDGAPDVPTRSGVCLSSADNIISLSTKSFDEWTLLPLDSTTLEPVKRFSLATSNLDCRLGSPCILIKGPFVGSDKYYLEKTLNSSNWSRVKIRVDLTTYSLDSKNDRAFVETECNGNINETGFGRNVGQRTHYLACIEREVENCDTFTLRIGLNVTGNYDFVWISQVLLEFNEITMNPTINPTTNPTMEPTVMPTIQPMSITLNPTTPAPTLFIMSNCFLNAYELISLNSYANWNAFVDGQNYTMTPDIFTGGGFTACQDANCFRFYPNGINITNVSRVYLEQTLDASQWSNIVIASIMISEHNTFVETVCSNGQVTTQMTGSDTNCLSLDASLCDALTLRIGVYLSNVTSNVVISKLGIVYDGAPAAPTSEVCLSSPADIDISVSTQSFDEWTLWPNNSSSLKSRFSLATEHKYCDFGTPCLQIVGGDEYNGTHAAYLEKTFNSSNWSRIKIRIDARTNSLEANNNVAIDFGYIATECNGIIETEKFHYNMQISKYKGFCLTRSTQNCDSFGLRIGLYAGGQNDYLWVSQVLLEVIEMTANPTIDPTTEPTIQPSFDPTIDPTLIPTFHPTDNPTFNPTFSPTTIMPTYAPSNDPTDNPTKSPTTAMPTYSPSNDPSSHPTDSPTVIVTSEPTVIPSLNPTHIPTKYPTTIMPSQSPITFYPTKPPLIPKNCFLDPHEIIDTTSYNNWKTFVDGKNTALDIFGITGANAGGGAGNCYGISPCLQLKGSGDGHTNRIYIEQTLDSSKWTNIKIALLVKSNEISFVETMCNNGKSEMQMIEPGMNCLPLNVSRCDSLKIRIGAYLSDVKDSIWISKVAIVYDGAPPAPTSGICLSSVDMSLNTKIFHDWKLVPSNDRFSINNALYRCDFSPQCIRINGFKADQSGKSGEAYLEKTLDSSNWQRVKIRVDLRTLSMENNDFAFVTTECNGITKTEYFGQSVYASTYHMACIETNVQKCDVFTLKIGSYTEGEYDYVFISRVLLQIDAPNPSINPTFGPTQYPIAMTLTPSQSPSQIPSQNDEENKEKSAANDGFLSSIATPTNNFLLIVIFAMILLFVALCCCGACFWKKFRQKRILRVISENLSTPNSNTLPSANEPTMGITDFESFCSGMADDIKVSTRRVGGEQNKAIIVFDNQKISSSHAINPQLSSVASTSVEMQTMGQIEEKEEEEEIMEEDIEGDDGHMTVERDSHAKNTTLSQFWSECMNNSDDLYE